MRFTMATHCIKISIPRRGRIYYFFKEHIQHELTRTFFCVTILYHMSISLHSREGLSYKLIMEWIAILFLVHRGKREQDIREHRHPLCY